MLGRPLLKAGILAAAVGTPFAIFHDGWKQAVKSKWNAVVGSDQPADSPSARNEVLADARSRIAAAGGSNTTDAGLAYGPTLTGPSADNFLAVLRFDVPPEWVRQQWSRVSAVLAETDLEGLRVPLVTGHTEQDLAGSLTYYFDHQRQVQRLAFEGTTGDPRKLIATLAPFYGFREERTLGAGLYLVKWNDRPTSVLKIEHAPIVRASSPHVRYHVRLEINRPGKSYGLSSDALAMLRHDDQTQRWE